MQCIIHIHKICLHADDALRQLKLKLKALPSNDTVIGVVSFTVRMQCIIHIHKICLHADDALRQLKFKLKALPSNDTVIIVVSLIIVNTVDLRWCPCVC
ncbi:hypothetical protein T12_12386 [Trichinella patagoniensis]|uniref:Uncharacterized protein n=1 Tax=Trichinella patagoniensis TaxID=990121 RepID=A0A0V0Z5Y6_9BILA|nr:hypothetical protein T12_12386 [Trichinella patagoniensis]